jgi:hypothetical protein
METIFISVSCWAFVGFAWTVRKKSPWWTYFASLAIVLALAYAATGLNTFAATTDVETWNGSITEKVRDKRDCPSGWNYFQDDFCTQYTTRTVDDGETCSTDSKGNRSCTRQSHTEYHYDYPWEIKWRLKSSDLDEEWEVDRVDPQGAVSPPLYMHTSIGDPASKTHRYTNWVRAASDSLFHEDGMDHRYDGLIPKYPQELYDLYKMDRIVQVGVDIPDVSEYNRLLSVALSELGPKRQMNAIIVLVDAKTAGTDYPAAVRRAWKGFKKNDAVVFIGLDGTKVAWSDVLSWSKDDMFNVLLKDDLAKQARQDLDMRGLIIRLHMIGMEHYSRREMAEFDYLRDEIPTPPWLLVLMYALQAGAVFGTAPTVEFIRRKI